MIYLIAYTTILSVKSEVYSLSLFISAYLIAWLHCIFCNYYQLIKVDILAETFAKSPKNPLNSHQDI